MKAKRFFMGMMLALCLAAPAVASGLGDIRVNARFLTDRMAFELSLTQTQYNDLYEVNYDFFSGIDPYVAAMARQEAYALDAYYRYLDERNDDLRWVLSSAEYVRFMALEYFFRPVYVLNRVCSLRIYQVYPNRTFFYFGRPAHYLTYCGGHSRRHLGGRSFYRARHPKVYRHPVYAGNFHSRPDFRKHDFAPGRPPQKGPGYHFTPARPSRPEAGPAHKPDKRPAVKPSRPDKKPAMRPSRPNRPDKKPAVKPSRPDKKPAVRPSRPNRPDKKPAVKPSRPDRKPQARPRPNRNVSKEREGGHLRRT